MLEMFMLTTLPAKRNTPKERERNNFDLGFYNLTAVPGEKSSHMALCKDVCFIIMRTASA